MALAPRTVQRIPDCFEPVTDDSLAARFDDSRTNEQRKGAELGVAHALGIGVEIVNSIEDLFLDGRIARTEPFESFQ